MRVAVDTNALYTTRAGTARYTRELLNALEKVVASSNAPGEAWSLEPFAWPVENFEFRQPRRAWRTFYREFVWARSIAPRALKTGGFDLLHSAVNPLLIPPPGIRHVVTVHDVGFLRFPERYRRWHRQMGIRALERSRTADRVLCISRFTADELIRLADFPADKLCVVHNGCSFQDGRTTAEPPVEPIPAEFLLFVGSLEPGKNLGLLRAMYELAAQQGVSLPDLVIVGARFAGLEGEGAPPRGWHYLGHLPDSQLLWLYQRAIALVFPSKYEGFGLPVAEAMTLGCPVVCSPVSSLPEVAGDAAILVNQEPAAYLEGVLRLVHDPQVRAEHAALGRQQASRFTWERCARETLDVYRQAAGP